MSGLDLLRLLRELPDDATLPARFVRDHLEDQIDPDAEIVDLRVEDVAQLMNKSPSTVRGWISAGDLAAYKLRGGEWRIRRADLRAMQDREAIDYGLEPPPL